MVPPDIKVRLTQNIVPGTDDRFTRLEVRDSSLVTVIHGGG